MKRTLAALGAVLFLVSGCANNALVRGGTGNTSTGGLPEYPAQLARFYEQRVEWTSCGKDQCARVQVPMNYEDPEGATIELSMRKQEASGSAVGSIFINPGGPGGSGLELLPTASISPGKDVVEKYNVIGFDPRGVGESTPITCFTDAELQQLVDTTYPDSDPEAGAKEAADARRVAERCKEKNGEYLKYVDTRSAAQDLDVLRHLVGDRSLNYLGYSYGTFLGAQYADLFPAHVGRMVLDGAVDTTLGTARLATDQTRGFEESARRFVEWCQQEQGSRCPLKGNVDEGIAHMRGIIDAATATPIATGNPNMPLTGAQALSAFTIPFYSKMLWPVLMEGISEVDKQNKGTVLQLIALTGQSRDPSDGHFLDNSTEANWAINCADYRPATDAELEEASRATKGGPLLGDAYAGSDLCQVWPTQAKENPGPFRAAGAAPIIVIGTKYDPATPQAWAKSLAEDLESGVLVTWEGDGHTAFGTAGRCIDDPIRQFYLTGAVPENLNCPAR
ncbi:alpha/beta hydrolase [Actinotignum sp. GS-2025b]|uniref:alpha/beta hydrolase n=1 Tax=Actinotignum sp. GS-2025b TaxID=3427275 RepID=UPI003F47E749